MNVCSTFRVVIHAMALLLPTSVLAHDAQGGVTFSGSGFLTLVAGKILGGDAPQDFNGYQAPIFVSDYGQGGVYENNGWSIRPDSKLGLQGAATFNSQFSITGQVVSRAVENGKAEFEWAYGNYNFSDRLSLQMGRKRLPFFYYSETQDIGFSYPWIHLPPGQYGWEIVNYNGANLRYQTQWGGWPSSMEVFIGNEYQSDSPFWTIYNGKNTRTDSKWSNIAGVDLTMSNDWLDARIAYIQSSLQNRILPADFTPKTTQKIYTFSFKVDYEHWRLQNELLYMDRKQAGGEEDYSQLYGIGYRFGKLLPMFTYNKFYQELPDPTAAEAWSTAALSFTYSLTATSDIKAEFDRWIDRNGSSFNGGIPYGNARIFSVSYDMIF